jgi:very-short-patch-repair endonuclease
MERTGAAGDGGDARTCPFPPGGHKLEVPKRGNKYPRVPSPSGRGQGEGPTVVSNGIRDHARRMRREPTDAEARLWFLLRGRRFAAFKFRRQYLIDRYIVDFYCHQSRLAIELDGGGHSDAKQAAYDERRSRDLQAAGIRVLRFWDNDVLLNTHAVLDAIWRELHDPHP